MEDGVKECKTERQKAEERTGREDGRITDEERERKTEGRRKEGLRTSPTYCSGLVMNSSNGS